MLNTILRTIAGPGGQKFKLPRASQELDPSMCGTDITAAMTPMHTATLTRYAITITVDLHSAIDVVDRSMQYSGYLLDLVCT